MKRLTLILLATLILFTESNAQLWKYKRYQITAYFGTSHFFCDGTQKKNVISFKDITAGQTRFNAGGMLKYWVTEDATIKGGLTYTLLHGTNIGKTNTDPGFSVTSQLSEFSAGGEYYFVKNKARASYRFLKGEQGAVPFSSLIDFYATAAIGATMFTVRPDSPSETRIQKDQGMAVTAPVGLGLNMVLTPDISTGAELLLHNAFTDYLDGYTYKSASRNDSFCTLAFSLTYKFKLKAKSRQV